MGALTNTGIAYIVSFYAYGHQCLSKTGKIMNKN